MSAYVEYGFDYRLKLQDGSYKTIISSSILKDRLLRSNYYENSKKELRHSIVRNYCYKADNVDITLSPNELSMIESAIDEFKPIDHGFYNFSSVRYTGV